MTRVPKLDWPVHLFQDVGVLELMDEDDQFMEAADLAAIAEDVSFSNDQASIVRYHYVGAAQQANIQHAIQT